MVLRSSLPSFCSKSKSGLKARGHSPLKQSAPMCQLLSCRCNVLTCSCSESHWASKHHGATGILLYGLSWRERVSSDGGHIHGGYLLLSLVCSIVPSNTAYKKKIFKDKIIKNWWQLSNQVWGPSDCMALCGRTGHMPMKPHPPPGFLLHTGCACSIFRFRYNMTWVPLSLLLLLISS